MKFYVAVVALFAIVVFAKVEYIKQYVPSFLEPLKKIHRGPPEIMVDIGNGGETKWMTQHLDYFDEQNKKTWQMRYIVHEEHFENGGPMFIFVGGEWDISLKAIRSGIFYDLAKEHKGILFFTEHRYYGQSIPTSDFWTENMQYLHAKQALGDLAHFIRTQHDIDSRLSNSKVIIAGCSYAGNLVIWFSKLYPELVNGGWASSAPLLAKVNFKEYNEISGRAFRDLGSQQCYNRIQNGIAQLEAMFADHRWLEAKTMLLLCNSFDHKDDLDLGSLFTSVANAFTKDVQYQTGAEISDFCNHLMSYEDDLSAVVAVFIQNNFFGQDCVDVKFENALTLSKDILPRQGNPRPWVYQLCNEFGWFQTTASREQPFGTKVSATLLTTTCYRVFGAKYTNEYVHELIEETNKFFGGLQPDVKNVYITYGALDPWGSLGQNETHGATVIPWASHCSDLNSISGSDSGEMRASKQRLVNLVRRWLA